MPPFNIAQHLHAMARAAPDRRAVICSHAPDSQGRTSLTFAQLNAESDALAWGLSEHGIKAGQRTLLGVRPGLDFIALTFALFKIGAVPVLIDPGMGRKNLADCVKRVRPQAMIAIAAAHWLLRQLVKSTLESPPLLSGQLWRDKIWLGPRVAQCRARGLSRGEFPLAPTRSDSLAAILFTSGGTGTPKGVCYEHGMFGAQVELIREHFQIQAGEIDLPAFPLFALFSTAMGVTSVIPDMNPSLPAQCNPDTIIDSLQSQNVTYTFGSPAIWKRVGPRCVERSVFLPQLQRILMAGAPVRGEVLAPFAKILSAGADVFIPYGATEALPVCSIRGSEVLSETWALTRRGKGYCVGRPLPRMSVKVIAADQTVTDAARLPEFPLGEIGEIVVQGPVVTKEYFDMPAETAQSKIGDPRSGEFWHRMGDMGYFDGSGRLWFCGRKAHRVISANGRAYYSVCCEAIFEDCLKRELKIDARAALVRIEIRDSRHETRAEAPALVVEMTGRNLGRQLESKIADVWKKEALAAEISAIFFYRKPFPVDVRHNAKIDREALGRWVDSAR